MSGDFVVGTMAVVLVVLLLFVSYYAYKLLRARREVERSAEDFEAWLAQKGPVEAEYPGDGGQGDAGFHGTSAGGVSHGLRILDRRLGLRSISEDPVFLRSDRNGEVTVQIGERPSMPLKYVLDVSAQNKLRDVVASAASEFGGTWTVLAQENEEGRLVLTRLS